MKRGLHIVLALIIAVSAPLLISCKKPVRDDENFLQIMVADFGYGHKWMQPLIDDFAEQAWVKDKYPNLDASYKTTQIASIPRDEVLSDKTTYDLLFATTSIKKYITADSNGKSKQFAEISDVYESTVPGESVKIKDRMSDFFYNVQKTDFVNGTEGYFEFPWVEGTMGMVYNATQFEALGIPAPLTTEHLNEICQTIKTGGKVPFVFSSSINYWTTSMFPIWWAQYEGAESYDNFFKGLHDDEGRLKYSNEIFKQTGRLRSLEVIEDLILTTNGNNYQYVNTISFTQAQTQFFLGNGLMMPNGNWLEEEMRSITAQGGLTDTFTFMKNPVVSEITEKLENTSMPEATLRAVIGAVDAGENSYEGVSVNDFAKIKEARNITMPLLGHVAYIPEYSNAKDLAKDFLRYMSTNEAQNIFAEATRGANMPFEYDMEANASTLFNSFTKMQQDKLRNNKDAVYIPHEDTYRINYFGGLRPLSGVRLMLEPLFTSQNASDRRSAQTIYDEEIAYWNSTRWTSILESAGLL